MITAALRSLLTTAAKQGTPIRRTFATSADEQRRAALRAQLLRGAPKAGASSTPTAAPALVGDRPLLFDTHALVVALERSGFGRDQAVAVADALVAVSGAAQRHALSQTVSKSAFADLRAELSILEKADFAVLKGDIATLEKRIETAVAELYTSVERVENRVIKWFVAVVGALGLGVLRLTAFSSPSSQNVTPTPATSTPPETREQFTSEPRLRLLHM